MTTQITDLGLVRAREREIVERLRDVKGLAPRGTIRGRSPPQADGARNSPIVAEASQATIAP